LYRRRLGAASPVHAQLIYGAGFEAPTFVVGPIAGQDGWTGGADVQSGTVQSGSQALHINGSGSSTVSAIRAISYAITPGLLVDFSSYFQITGGGAQAGIELMGNTGLLAQLITNGTTYRLGNSNSGTPTQPFANGVWHLLEIRFDFTAGTSTGWVDGQLLGTLPINTPSTPTQLGQVLLYSLGTHGPAQDVYFDNVSVTNSTGPTSAKSTTWGRIKSLYR
jgi:hypothetical protein